MRNLSLLFVSAAFCAPQEAAEGSIAYQGSFLDPSMTYVSYSEGPDVVDLMLRGPATSRLHQSQRISKLTPALFGVLAVALSVAYLIVQCFMLLKSRDLFSGAARRLAAEKLSCSVSAEGAPCIHIARSPRSTFQYMQKQKSLCLKK